MSSSKSNTLKRLSCDRCHSQKLRCPRSGDNAPCGRCQRQGFPCTFSAPLPRGRPRGGTSHSTHLKESKATPDSGKNAETQAPVDAFSPDMGYWGWLPNDFQQGVDLQLAASDGESIIQSVTSGIAPDPLHSVAVNIPTSPLGFSPFSLDSGSAPGNLAVPMLMPTRHEDRERCVSELSALTGRLYSVSNNCKMLGATPAGASTDYTKISLEAIFSILREPAVEPFSLAGPSQAIREAYDAAQSFLHLVSTRTQMAPISSPRPSEISLGNSNNSANYQRASSASASPENVILQEGAVFHLVLACYSLLLQTFGALALALDMYASTCGGLDNAGQSSLLTLRLILLKDTIYFFFRQLESTMIAYAQALDTLSVSAKNHRPETDVGQSQGHHARLESVAKSESQIIPTLEQLHRRLAHVARV